MEKFIKFNTEDCVNYYKKIYNKSTGKLHQVLQQIEKVAYAEMIVNVNSIINLTHLPKKDTETAKDRFYITLQSYQEPFEISKKTFEKIEKILEPVCLK